MDSSAAYTLGLAIIIAGYFIGNGIRNGLVCLNKGEVHKDETSLWDLFKVQIEDILQQKFVKKKYLRKYLGLSKKEVDSFINQYTDIPSVNINGKTYYIREEFHEWIKNLSNNK